MKSSICENCIKYKTMYCPNSNECLARKDKPFYEDKYTILTKNEALEEVLKDYTKESQQLKIQISAREEEYKKLEQEIIELKNNYNRIYNENCKLREEHNINDISLLDENAELKIQLEENKLNHKQLKDLKKIQKSFTEVKKQQQKFIKYLEKRYKDITSVIGSYGSNTDMLYGKKDILEEVLDKYEEIIGENKDE